MKWVNSDIWINPFMKWQNEDLLLPIKQKLIDNIAIATLFF